LEFREYRLASKKGEDVLSLYDTLYHVYRSLPGLSELVTTQKNLPTPDHPNLASSPESTPMDVHASDDNWAMAADDVPSPCAPPECGRAGRNLRKLLLRKENRKKKRHDELQAPRAAGWDRKFCCPLCPEESFSNRNSLLQHL